MVTLVCTGGVLPPPALSRVWIEAAQFIIAADSGLELVRRSGRQADLWIGDGDSLGEVGSPLAKETIKLSNNKDETDTEAAVRTALGLGEGVVWLMGGGGGRMDHWLSNLKLVEATPRVKRWLTSEEEIWNLEPGERLELPQGTVSMFPLGKGPWKIHSRGLRWPVDQVDFSVWHSQSNEITGPDAGVTVEAGRFLVIRPLEGRTWS